MTTEVRLLVIYIFWDQTDARKMERVKMVHPYCAFRDTVHKYTQHTVQSAQQSSFILTYAHCRPLYMTIFR